MKSFRKLWSLGMVLLVMGFVVLGGARESRGHLISVVKGNKPVENMGWPLGTTNITNLKSRLGYIEGPPFGGGMYEFFYRCGNTAEFNEILKSFAAIRAPEVELVVHDGPEHVFWFEGDMNKRIPQPETRIDWKFLAWVPYNWHRLNNSPKSYVMSDNPDFRKPVPGPKIDVYVGEGTIDWEQVMVPENIKVIDKRSSAAPVKVEGGSLYVGDIYDMTNRQQIADAEIRLMQRQESRNYKEIAKGKTDETGSFQIEKIPTGYYEVWIKAEGYAGRKLTLNNDRANTYHKIFSELLPVSFIKGVVVDLEGNPIRGASVSPSDVLGIDGMGYECWEVDDAVTDDEGRFRFDNLPIGHTRLRCRMGTMHLENSIFELHEIPHPRELNYQGPKTIELVMTGTGVVQVKLALSPEMSQTVILERPLSLGEQQYLDLDTGEYVFKSVNNVNPEHLINQGVDVYMTFEKPTPGAPAIPNIKSLGLAFREAPWLNLQEVSKGTFDESISIAVRNLEEPQWLTGYSTNPTYAFRTAMGKAGVISFAWSNEGACAVQYRLLPEADIPIEKFPWTFGAHGVQNRLRARKTTWKVDEAPILSLDLRNLSEKTIEFVRIAEAHCEIEIDGHWYGWTKPIIIDAPVWALKPGTELNDAIEIKITDSWALPKEMNTLKFRPGIEEFWGEQLKLTPGKHTVRVRFRPQEWMEGYIKGEKDLPIVSNPVEIEILPE